MRKICIINRTENESIDEAFKNSLTIVNTFDSNGNLISKRIIRQGLRGIDRRTFLNPMDFERYENVPYTWFHISVVRPDGRRQHMKYMYPHFDELSNG